MRGLAPISERNFAVSSHTSKLPPPSVGNLDPNSVARRLRDVYADTLRMLMAADGNGTLFSAGDQCPIAEYDRTVKKPMDFKIMLQKVDGMIYLDDPSLFDEDIALIVKNVKAYNPSTSPRYKAALALERLYASLRHTMFKRVFNVLEHASRRNTHSVGRPRLLPPPTSKEGPSVEVDTFERVGCLDPTSAFKNRPRRKYPFPESQQDKPHLRPPRSMHPIIYAVNQTMMGENYAWEQVGTCLNSPGGLNRVLNAIEAMYARLLETPYAKMTWFDQFAEPYTRILKEFEYRKFAADVRTSDSVDPEACTLLMNRLKTGNYKDSILGFVGHHNMKKLNAMFPKLMDTLNDLHVNPHLVATPTQLKF